MYLQTLNSFCIEIIENRISGVMVSVYTYSVVDCGLEAWLR
jgi:hypothetical protein